MNERIRELLPNPFAVDYQYKDGPLDLYTEKEMEKFAELIVRECLAVMSDTAQEANNKFTYMGDDVPTSAHQVAIKEHFGIE